MGKWLLCFASQNFGLSPIKYTYVPCTVYNTIPQAYHVYKTFKGSYPGQVKPHTCQNVLWKMIKNKYICCLLVVLKSIMDRLHHTSLHRMNRIHKCVNWVFAGICAKMKKASSVALLTVNQLQCSLKTSLLFEAC